MLPAAAPLTPPCQAPTVPRTVPEAAMPGCQVRAPGRLHLGFFDPSAALGRRFGSLGLVIDGFETVVTLQPADQDQLLAESACDGLPDGPPGADAGPALARAAVLLQRLRQASGCHQPLCLRLGRLLPAHAGLGSGTQLALAIGHAFATLHGLAVDTPTLAQWGGRGARSGVGIAGFDQGGLLVDGGPGADGRPAPLLSRIAFPADWRVVVVLDHRLRGLSGQREQQAMATLAPLPQPVAADICHQVLMRVLPGAAEAQFAPFAAGLSRIQQVLGAHFAPAQGGNAYTSPAVGRLLQWMASADGAAVGQSSWGPTGFAVLPSEARAQALVAAAQQAGLVADGLQLRVVAGRNHGAVLG